MIHILVTLHLIDPKAQQENSRAKTRAEKHQDDQPKGLDLDSILYSLTPLLYEEGQGHDILVFYSDSFIQVEQSRG